MNLTSHKSEAVHCRYAIVSSEDLRATESGALRKNRIRRDGRVVDGSGLENVDALLQQDGDSDRRIDGRRSRSSEGGVEPAMLKTTIFTLALALAATLGFGQTPCERLKSLSLPNSTITSAEAIPAGPYLPIGLPSDAAQYAKVQIPAYCRVALVLTPTPDSHIEVELWMPGGAAWNGKYQAVGGGGWVGTFNFSAMTAALQQGYATSSTDTGHKGGDAAFAVGHPEKVVDFAYRAVHEMTVKSKTIMTAFYGRGARLSYWNGCSTGGRQGLMEASRYPRTSMVSSQARRRTISFSLARGEQISIRPFGKIPGESFLARRC